MSDHRPPEGFFGSLWIGLFRSDDSQAQGHLDRIHPGGVLQGFQFAPDQLEAWLQVSQHFELRIHVEETLPRSPFI